MKQEDSKRQYAKYVHELAKSNKKKLQFNFVDYQEAGICLKNVRECIERNGYDMTAYKVRYNILKSVVYVEKI